MIDRISLLTQFPWRFGFNSRGLKSIGLISSSRMFGVQGENSIKIQRLITTNLAPIGSRLSLNAGESWWTQDLPSNSLNCFMNRAKFKERREEHRFLKRNSREKSGPFDLVRVDSWPRSRDDRGPQSHDDRGPRSHDLASSRRPISISVSRWVHVPPP